MVFKLFDIPAFLTCLHALCPGIIQYPHIFRPGYHPVEIIRPHGILELIRRQAEPLPQLRRDERGTDAFLGEYALIGRHQDNVPEIQGPRLQRPHNLESLERLAPERDGDRTYQLLQYPDVCKRLYGKAEASEPVDGPVIFPRELQLDGKRSIVLQSRGDMADKLHLVCSEGINLVPVRCLQVTDDRPEHQFEKPAPPQILLRDEQLGLLPYPADGGFALQTHCLSENAVGEQGTDLAVIEAPSVPPFSGMQKHCTDAFHHSVEGTCRHRVAHCHIYILYLRRDGVQKGHQERFVRQDNGRILRGAAYDVRQQLDLAYGGWYANDLERRHLHTSRVRLETLRELPDILRHEERRLVPAVPDHVPGIVPAELRGPAVPHLAHEGLFTFVQGVQPDEHISGIPMENAFENIGHRLVLQSFRELPVYHALIRQALGFKGFAEITVKRVEDIPDLEETFLDIGAVGAEVDREPAAAVVEMPDEILYRRPLRSCEIFKGILHGLEIGHIGIQHGRVGQILVHIIEVPQDDIPPENEFIETFRLGVQGLVAAVKLEEERYPVRAPAPVDLLEEVVDSEHPRSLHRDI